MPQTKPASEICSVIAHILYKSLSFKNCNLKLHLPLNFFEAVKKIISESTAVNSLLVVLSAIVIFHLLVIVHIIPYQIVWGGRIENRQQIIPLELISIIINLVMMGVVLIKKGVINFSIGRRWLRLLFWLMFVFFLVNTLGNLVSLNQIEKFIFTPITLFLTFCSLRLGLSK